MNNVTKITSPFRFWCQKVIPLVYDDSLSYYELLCKVVDYLNNIMNALNTNADAITELQQSFVQLQNYVNNYFANLDVQTEIDNKLDQMVTDGTLATIINEEIFSELNTRVETLEEKNNVLYFETFQNLITNNSIVNNGNIIITNGFLTNNDNGKATYTIDSTDKGVGILLRTGIYANIYAKEKINILQLGNFVSDTINYTSQVQTIITYCKNNKIELNFNPVNYYFSNLNFECNINGNNCTFNMGYFNTNNPVAINYNTSNITCKNYIVDGTRFGSLANVRTDLRDVENIILDNVTTNNFIDTVTVNAWGILITRADNIKIYNGKGTNCSQSTIAIVEDSTVLIRDTNVPIINIEPNNVNNPVNVKIENTNADKLTILGNSRYAMYIICDIINSYIKELYPRDCVLNSRNTIYDSINCATDYAPGSFRGNIDSIKYGLELNSNPYFANIIPESGSTLLNGYTLGYTPSPLTSILKYTNVVGVGNLLDCNFNKVNICNITLSNPINVLPNQYYQVKVKYIVENASTLQNSGDMIKPTIKDSSNNELVVNRIIQSGVGKASENSGIQEDYFIIKTPTNSAAMNIAIGTYNASSSNYKFIELSIKQVFFKFTN